MFLRNFGKKIAENSEHNIDPRFSTTAAGKRCRVARFFLVQTYQNEKNIPNDHKLYQTAINYVHQMAVNYSK
jgi:hypothetical protein